MAFRSMREGSNGGNSNNNAFGGDAPLSHGRDTSASQPHFAPASGGGGGSGAGGLRHIGTPPQAHSVSFNLSSGAASHRAAGMGPHSHNQQQHSSGGGGGGNDVHALRSKVSALEIEVSSLQHAAADGASAREAADALRLERDVAKRNCEILTANVETLKALSLEMATQLDQTNVRCKTLEEKIACAGLRRELHDFEGADAMRKLYEGRLGTLERALQKAAEAADAAQKAFVEREAAQDERVLRLERSKDESILRLMRENEKLRAALGAASGATSAGGGSGRSGGGGGAKYQQTESAADAAGRRAVAAGDAEAAQRAKEMLNQFRADKRQLRATSAAAAANVRAMTNAAAARLASNATTHSASSSSSSSSRHQLPLGAGHPSTSNTDAVLRLTVESRDIVAMANASFPPEVERRLARLQQQTATGGSNAAAAASPSSFVPPGTHALSTQQQYSVEMQIDDRRASAVDAEAFAALVRRRRRELFGDNGGADDGNGGNGFAASKAWHFITDTEKAIRIVVDTI